MRRMGAKVPVQCGTGSSNGALCLLKESNHSTEDDDLVIACRQVAFPRAAYCRS